MRANNDIGIIGCSNTAMVLAKSMLDAGHLVVIFDRDPKRLAISAMEDTRLKVALGLKDLVAMVKAPKKFMLFEDHFSQGENSLHGLKGCLPEGSIVVDAGLVHRQVTQARASEFNEKDIRYMSLGIARDPMGHMAFMVGGHPKAWKEVKPLLDQESRNDTASHYFGPGGSGQFVKTIHDSLEFCVLQMISESYELLRTVLAMNEEAIGQTFIKWHKSDLSHSLVSWMGNQLLSPKDKPDTPIPSAKTAATWAIQDALKWDVPLSIISEAVFAASTRESSKDNPLPSQLLSGPKTFGEPASEPMIGAVKTALKCALITSYSQAFKLLDAGSYRSNYDLDLGDIARLWKIGSSLSCWFLNDVASYYTLQIDHRDFLLSGPFAKTCSEAHGSLRLTLNLGASRGVPLPCLTAALAYYDNYRTKELGLSAQARWHGFIDRREQNWPYSNP